MKINENSSKYIKISGKKEQNPEISPKELAKQITAQEVRDRRDLILSTITAETEAIDKPKAGRTSGLSHKF